MAVVALVCIFNGHLSGLFFPPPLFTVKGEKRSRELLQAPAKLLPWHGTAICVWSTFRMINTAGATLFCHTDLTYRLFFRLPPSLRKLLSALGSPINQPRCPFSACIPTRGSNSPVPLAALWNVRERSKHPLVILWPISVCLYRSMGWRN